VGPKKAVGVPGELVGGIKTKLGSLTSNKSSFKSSFSYDLKSLAIAEGVTQDSHRPFRVSALLEEEQITTTFGDAIPR
jgi:hypothetical protein